MTLDELGLKHGTDKCSKGHDYLNWYEPHFVAWRDQPIAILEIGVWHGASLRTWRDYFPQARVIGIDKDQKCARHSDPRITVCIGDQVRPAFLDQVNRDFGPFDLIIDDGGHNSDAQIRTMIHLLPKMVPGGLYIIEDIIDRAVADELATLFADRVVDGGFRELRLHIAWIMARTFAVMIRTKEPTQKIGAGHYVVRVRELAVADGDVIS